MRKTHFSSGAARMGGFSLVELMVALVIGMVSILVVMQVFALSEGSKRTTTGGDDAQNTGSIALLMLQRDIRQAGYGLSSVKLLGCNLALPAPASWTLNALAPVTINHADIPAGDAGSDTFLVAYGNGGGSSEGDLVAAQPAATTYRVVSPGAVAVGDRLIALSSTLNATPRPTPCNVGIETAVTVPSPNVNVAVGVANMANGVLFNLGPSPRILAYAVRDGSLTVCDGAINNCSDASAGTLADRSIWVPVGDGIVGLRAQYGWDTTAAPGDGSVDTYSQSVPAAVAGLTTACQAARVPALRVALVTRSGQFEKTDVTDGGAGTAPAPAWAGQADDPIDLSAIANWKRYRYKTFETTVPLRNMAWQGVQSGC
ncbi:PilW family protein [Rivibacter subsaxonicus]|uniref:Type IV pilus assembly protein PilW n=1 Tax=Rivibacter subsaxonicus TaxID=457575 RepID=A0A4Q7VVC1_9BURK|nr:PilW family protein [Rivibacter subsaxonicus]RZU00523.1 type IV pilus assembly protein PilW [Rivibacter subsaxonicus]